MEITVSVSFTRDLEVNSEAVPLVENLAKMEKNIFQKFI